MSACLRSQHTRDRDGDSWDQSVSQTSLSHQTPGLVRDHAAVNRESSRMSTSSLHIHRRAQLWVCTCTNNVAMDTQPATREPQTHTKKFRERQRKKHIGKRTKASGS